jgi:hypothetical protein
MKRTVFFLLCLVFLFSASLAEPLVLLEDYAGDISEPDEYGGTFTYSYRYPHVDENAEGASAVNVFYLELIDYDLGFTVPIIQENHEGSDCSTRIDYTVTCNNDDYFSVLIRKEEIFPDFSRISWTGHNFSRRNPKYDHTYTLPELLGLLDVNENDTWMQDRQTAKADDLVRGLVWEMIEDNTAGVEYDEDYSEEKLASDLFPEEQFFLDENGDPVFYLQPGVAADESCGLLTFSIPLETILDEM